MIDDTPPVPVGLPKRAAQYWPVFWDIGRRYGVDPLLIASICDVESECGESKFLDRHGPGGRGDMGHGHGLFQVDDRFHLAFLKRTSLDGAPSWADPLENCNYAIGQVLVPAFRAFPGIMVGGIAAYNAGIRNVRNAFHDLTTPTTPIARLAAANSVTTGKNYVTRVLMRYRTFGGEPLIYLENNVKSV